MWWYIIEAAILMEMLVSCAVIGYAPLKSCANNYVTLHHINSFTSVSLHQVLLLKVVEEDINISLST
jgi:hypothetical protein